MKIIAETRRLILRELLPEDAEGMFELDSDPEVHLFLGNNPVRSISQSKQYIETVRKQYEDFGVGRVAIIEKSSGAFLGWAGLKFIRETTNKHINYYDAGYRLIKKYWGKGFATEAAQATIDYGFNTLNLTEIFAIADLKNLASIHVLEKTGFKKIEIFNYEGVPHHWMKIERP